MARLVLPVAGAAVGFAMGGAAGAKWGWMAGAMLGSLIPSDTQGPSIDESGAQTTAEGAARSVVYGTAMVTGNVIDAGKTRKITRKQRQGKGGQSTSSEALLRTYAIRICEGPIAGVLMVKKDEKIVYDVRLGAGFEEDNAEFLKKCRLYLGDEAQLPDPDLEAIHGVGEVPAHRGSAYIVLVDDDVTDRRGSIPQYEFVVGAAKKNHVVLTKLPVIGDIGGVAGGGAISVGPVGTTVTIRPPASTAPSWPSFQYSRSFLMLFQYGVTTAAPTPLQAYISIGGIEVWASEPLILPGTGTSSYETIQVNAVLGDDGIVLGIRAIESTFDGWWYLSGSRIDDMQAWIPEKYQGGGVPLIQKRGVPEFGVFRSTDGSTLRGTRAVYAQSVGEIPWGPDFYDETVLGEGVALSEIVADISLRCGVDAAGIDVSELTDSVDGLVLASSGYAGAEAINALRAPYFFDRCEWGGKIRYIKRGKPSVATITHDDLVDEPDDSERQAQIEYPRKLHLSYQSAAVNYETAQATSERNSPDVVVTGESSMQVPVVLAPAAAALIAAKLHKVAWAEAAGEVKFSLPESWLSLVPSDCITLELRGASRRLRIDSLEHTEGVLKVTARADRASAYASSVNYIPLPEPARPVSAVVGNTVLAVLDLPALRDQDDAMLYYAAVSGAKPAWYGALLQRSLDAGASFEDTQDMAWPATMGVLVAGVSAASPWYTDSTNVIEVELVREGGSLDSVTDTQLLSRGGGIALQHADGSWEIAQYRDARHVSGQRYALSHLHRGQLNTEAGPHAKGSLMVLLSDLSRVVTDSALLGSALTHRAVSFGASTESAAQQTLQYRANAQREWPVAQVTAARSGATLHAACIPRHRFGNDENPVASGNFVGWRWSLSGDGQTFTQDTSAAAAEFDISTMVGVLVLSVAQLNRITGPGPVVSIEV